MKNPFKCISVSVLPNFSFRDVVFVCTSLVCFWNYFDKKPEEKFRLEIGKYLKRKHVVLFESGRAAEYFLLKSLGIGIGDEVIVQAFTCEAVPSAVLWVGAKPIYCDIEKKLNIDTAKLGKLVSKNTRAIILQHTFGIPADVSEIKKIIKGKNIFLIEDLAHGFGNKQLGQNSVASFLSFGLDKAISAGGGGAVATNDKKIYENLIKEQEFLNNYETLWVIRKLALVPVLYFVSQTYNFFGFGKWIFAKLHTYFGEYKKQRKPEKFYKVMPSVMAKIGLRQIECLDAFWKHREELSDFYQKEIGGIGGNLRYGFIVKNRSDFIEKAKVKNVILGDWYDSVITPKEADLADFGYKKGSCPKAEDVSEKIINLPTNPNIDFDDARKVLSLIKEM